MTLDGSATNAYTTPARTSRHAPDQARRSCGRLSRWFVVRTLPRQAFQAELALSSDGWRVFHPLHLHRTMRHPPRIVSLFPGYVFVFFDLSVDDWTRVLRAHGVQALLGTPGFPAPVQPGVVEQLQDRCSDRRIVDDPMSEQAWSRLRPDTVVDVMDGPLIGLRGVTKMTGPERCRVLLTLLGRPVVVEVATKDLEVA